MTKLYIMNGPEKGKAFNLKGKHLTIGRSSESDIQIRDSAISRRHLKIIKKRSKYFIEDIKSANGTLLSGERIEPGIEYEIRKGRSITIGKTDICLTDELPEDKDLNYDSELPTTEIDIQALRSLYKDRPDTYLKNMELIYKVSKVLMESLDISEIFKKIMDYLFDSLKRIDRGAILLLDNKTGKLEQIIARSRYGKGKTTLNYSRTIVNQVIKERRPVTMPDISLEDSNDFSASMKLIRSVICVPLISKSEVRGVIYVDSLDMPHVFRKEDLLLLMALSSPAAVAIENALLYSNLEKLVESKTKSLRDTEKKLRESEARFKGVFDNMSSGVIVYETVDKGRDFKIIDLNRAAQDIEKITRNQKTGKKVSQLLPGLTRAGLLKVLNRVWRTGKPERHSFTLSRGGEITGWREYYVYRLSSKEIATIFDDITDKKRAEAEQEVLQEQLVVSQKMESIGAFAGGTAHNFRNLLQAILGNIEYLELLYGGKPEIKELTKSVYDSIEKGTELINNLLHFSKKGGKYELMELDLFDVIKSTRGIIEKVFDKNIEITAKLEKNLFIKGNHSFLSQIFMNLFHNAKDAMPNGGKLVIKARKDKNRVVVTVSDTGHGMDKDTQSKIFDPFFTLKEVGEGTGLGLSTTHGIVERHKGSISVSSKPGKGTIFKLSFPLLKIQKEQKNEIAKKIILGKGQKVLIVDDEQPTLDALSSLIKRLGYEPLSVDRASKAIKSYKQWAPDVVLMDRSMPEIDGVTCVKKIIKSDPDARIVIISGYEETGPDGIDEDVKNLIKGYLIKPCGVKELGDMLSHALRA